MERHDGIEQPHDQGVDLAAEKPASRPSALPSIQAKTTEKNPSWRSIRAA